MRETKISKLFSQIGSLIYTFCQEKKKVKYRLNVTFESYNNHTQYQKALNLN